jgi:hypothetical protein
MKKEIDMEIITHVVATVAGALVGLAGYRSWLKRDPDSLESWAKKIKDARLRSGY